MLPDTRHKAPARGAIGGANELPMFLVVADSQTVGLVRYHVGSENNQMMFRAQDFGGERRPASGGDLVSPRWVHSYRNEAFL